jgi:CheY-like chemotaxis protein
MMAVDMLEEAGFFALEAANADEAIALLESRTDISVLFTDIDMPGSMDGVKLAAAVADRWPPVRIVLTSGHVDPEAILIPAGAAFFSKPYNTAQVIREIRHLADGS